MSDVQPEAQPEEVVAEAPAAEPVPVKATEPSSASNTQQPEAAPVAAEMSLEEATRTVVRLVREHRTCGDGDLDAALSVVEAALPPLSE